MMNDYLKSYISSFIKAFRSYNDHSFSLTIFGLGSFISNEDVVFVELIDLLKHHGFDIKIEGIENSIDSVMVFYSDEKDGKSGYYNCCIDSLPLLIELSSKTDVPLMAIIIMKVIAQLVCREKILYKAIVLDLDNTLWNGTLSEDGIEAILQRMSTKEGESFLYFMRFVRVLAKELGIFVAICSRNDSDIVQSAIEKLDDSVFPIKDQIDLIIANNNNKSDNIKIIADELSILPQAVVFIDDNAIVRDEVRNAIPEVFVPEWSNHYDLVTLLITICAFERLDLSKKSQGRKGRMKILQAARLQSKLPALKVAMSVDENHSRSKNFYAKANQFKFNRRPLLSGTTSVVYTLYRENGDEIGECSSVSYIKEEDKVRVVNWAISCAFFEIGLEEFILLQIIQMAEGRKLYFDYDGGVHNQKVKELLSRYSDAFVPSDCESYIELINLETLVDKFTKNTNLVLK